MTQRCIVALAAVVCFLAPQDVSAQTAADVQRGDVSVGYSFMWEDGLTLPAGIMIADAWRVRPNLDVVLEFDFNHGTFLDAIGANIFTYQAGVRGSFGSAYGERVTQHLQLLAGMVTFRASALGDSVSSSGLAIQPGYGLNIPVSRVVSIRPQLDWLISRVEGSWGHDRRVTLSAAFRFFQRQ